MKLIEVKENLYVPAHRVLYVAIAPDRKFIDITVENTNGNYTTWTKTFNTEEELRGFFNSLQR